MSITKTITPEETNLRIGLMAVFFLYVAVYGSLLIATNGLPYVLDNNETFSSIIHAQNILTYGMDLTYGLTDESYGLTPESHPYVYTHQGNFPRFFATLIYMLGAHSAEAQITITTFVIGGAAISFAYHLITQRAGWVMGVVFCALLITDYVMVTQWQVSTWRVWHMFLFFLPLMCVDRAATGRPLPWLILLLVTHVALFYFELIFAAFTAVTTGLFAIFTLKWRFRLVVTSIAAQAAGMVLGIGILVAQLWAYLGWEDFITDLRLTFLVRNESISESSRAALEQFMLQHKIVFWYNINEVVGLRQPSVMLENFFALTLGVYSPYLGAAAAIVTFGVLIYRLTCMRKTARLLDGAALHGNTAQAIIGGVFFAFAILVILGMDTGAGAQGSSTVETVTLALITLTLTNNLMNRTCNQTASSTVPLATVAPPIAVLALAILWLLTTKQLYASPTLYNRNLFPVWSAAVAWTGPLLLQMMVLFAGYAAARISFGNLSPAAIPLIGRLSQIFAILVSGLLAYAVVYQLSPGYVLTGYLNRFVPLVTFVNLLPFAITICAIIAVVYGDMTSLRRKPWWRALWFRAKGGVRVRPLAIVILMEGSMLLVSAVAAATFPYYWAILQSTYLERLPPNQLAFLALLKEPPFKGASFVVNNYAAPMAVTTAQWAYYDSLLGYRRLESDGNQIRLARDLRYLWLADRDTNPAYLQPDYFLCVALQNGGTAIWPNEQNTNGCSRLPLIRTAGETIPGLLTTELVARDNTRTDRWAILRLNWHRPAPKTSAKESPKGLAEERGGR